jgi:hypothetical protein
MAASLVLDVEVCVFFACYVVFLGAPVPTFSLLFALSLSICFAALYTIEFQKRGLPFAHLLIWLDCHRG